MHAHTIVAEGLAFPEGPVWFADGSVVVVEWGRGMAEGLREVWWELEIERPVGGRGADTMCGDLSRSTEALDDDAPRVVTISRRP